MDFIKTSSLRALIELTFQRNWNGLIWMSRKGVTTKRVKTGPDGSIENQRPNRADRLAEERMFTLGQITSVRLKSRPKFKTFGRSRITTREACPAVGHATTAHAMPRTTSRASRETKPRGRATFSRTTADGAVRAGNYVPRPAKKSSAKLHPSDHDRSDSY
ncbi:unnamed protein product [Microthlaspi erraticum]|uniref:Uncharacterized protein n=1 Tax=Microthlaspi erraticum TaxID=1685480 RepID=A0A6D2IMJ5_9BRAS|nr:unnamed protein product [Microthlaspi erraticum]